LAMVGDPGRRAGRAVGANRHRWCQRAGRAARPYGRTRRAGGGPKRAVERQPGLLQALDRLVDPDSRGDPESPLRWTTKSTRHLAEALGAQGFQVADDTVGRLLKQQGYRLQRTRKTLEGAQHPDRDAQFGYLNNRPASTWLPASRSSWSTPRSRNWSATTQVVVPSGNRPASRSRSTCTTSPTPRSARRSLRRR
jgi:transposase